MRSRYGWLTVMALLFSTVRSASAFCGFFVSGSDQRLYNSASHVVLMRLGKRTVMTMSNSYKGPAEDFAMVVPVPVVLHKKQVKTLSPSVFKHIDELTAPRLVEYWEQDPCGGGPRNFAPKRASAGAALAMDDVVSAAPREHGVTIEAKFTSGEYQILILSAEESGGLETWLREKGYKIPTGAAEALAPYVQNQMKFFVAKVDIQKVKRDGQGQAMLSPLQFSFESTELRLPVRLGLLNAAEKQDLLVYILNPKKRFEVANYTNVFIPTNLEVANGVRKTYGAFYAELFDETLRHANNRAVVTEYAWNTSTCDPCPGEPLDPSELATLGAPQDQAAGEDWVVTRLHTRYDQKTLSEDLVFRTAKAVVGGRADVEGPSSEHGAKPSPDGTNNFQGRFIMRHYWAGKIQCESPQRGIWGGPPDGREPRPFTARDLANAPRGQVDLAAVVKSKVPSLGLTGAKK